MAKPTTYVLMITDMSGSMWELAADVRGGFNAYIADLAKDTEAKYRLSVALFDTVVIPLCRTVKLADAPKLDGNNYMPRGATALLDAVGVTILDFEAKTALGEKDRVLVVVQTDGFENSSQEFSREQITKMIKEREDGGKWSFLFIGAGPDAWRQAGVLGFQGANTVSVEQSGLGTRNTYSGLGAGTRRYARGATGQTVSMAVVEETGGTQHDEDEKDPA